MRTDPLRLADFYSHAMTQVGWMHVQVFRRGETLCGAVLDGFTAEGGREVVKVRTAVGEGWVNCDRVRRCSGVDGRCTCAGEKGLQELGAGAAATAPSSCAVPLGNTGTTVVEVGVVA